MKNIHVLPTSQPSRLFYNEEDALLFKSYEKYNGVNIYITSDEEIKEGDWFLTLGVPFKCSSLGFSDILAKKIILTTDVDLIKDGIQSIDDDFIEWFVKNPTCEEVKIRQKPKVHAIVKGIGVKSFNNGYKIVIPKELKSFNDFSDKFFGSAPLEEPKSNLAKNLKSVLDDMTQEEFDKDWNKVIKMGMEGPSFAEYNEDCDCNDECLEYLTKKCKTGDDVFINIPEPNEKLKDTFKNYGKQETLEEACDRIFLYKSGDISKWYAKKLAIELAKWQAERSQKIVPFDAYDIEVFAIKPDENGKLFAYIGYKISNGNFEFNVVPFTEPQSERMYSHQEVIDLLETQRGNSYVAILSATKNDELASIALNAPEPGGLKKL